MNRESYDRIAPQWNAARRAFVGRERDYLDLVLAAAPLDSTILDLGCGTGCPQAEYVVAQQRRVLGVDQSAAMLAIAQERLPSERWTQSAMETYEPAEGYHGALLWDSLFHVARTEHALIVAKLLRRLEPGGRLMLTVGGSAHPAFSDEMFGEQFFYDSNTPQETEHFLRELGCRLLVAEFMERPDGGRNKGRYAIVAEKPIDTGV